MDEDEGVAYYSKDFKWEDLRDEIEGIKDGVHKHDDEGEEEEEKCESSAAWEGFHRRHREGIFFKERRYLLKEFPELSGSKCRVLEIGCGSGSSILPILRANKDAMVYACDVSESAVNIARKSAAQAIGDSANSRLRTFVCDPSLQNLPTWLHSDSVQSQPLIDFVTMVFTLSAVPYQRMSKLISQCFASVRSGGKLFFRDYGLYDMTMVRFDPKQKAGNLCYRRSDGTLAYFFSCEIVRELFTAAGFVEEELDYCCVQLMNRRKKIPMKRVWVHAIFSKP